MRRSRAVLMLVMLSAVALLFLAPPLSRAIVGRRTELHSTPSRQHSVMGNSQKKQEQGSGSAGSQATFVTDTIGAHKVVVFSKTTCPYCHKAKNALASLLNPDQFYSVELDKRSDGNAIQDVLGGLTGGRTVPRVFIDGVFIGGGDDTARMAKNGELQKRLKDCGVL